jgi:ribosomal protein S18 acetylase RimI-like enzyme
MHGALVAGFAALFERLDGAVFERRARHLFVLCPPVPFPEFNGVWAQDDDADARAGLAAALEHVEKRGLPFGLLTMEGRHPSLEEEARRLGLARAAALPAMVADQSDLVDLPASDLAIRRASGRRALEDAERVCEAGFALTPGALSALYGTGLAAAPGLSYYLGYVQGEPVSTAIGLAVGETVGIFNVGTTPGRRRRGYGTAVTERAIRDGFDRGARLAWLQASQLGEPVYERMGFRTVGMYNLFARA